MKSFTALDCETVDYGCDSACTVGLVRVEHNQIVQRIYSLIRPPHRNFQFTNIHSIGWSDVVNQPTFGDLWEDMNSMIDDIDFLVAHNATFDRRVLYAYCDQHGISRPSQPFICTVQLARKTWNIRPTKLPHVCEYLNIPLEHHHALADAEACARIVIAAHQSPQG